MQSFLDRSPDADLDKLVRELAARRSGNARRSFRLKAWRFTIAGAYALKRLIDIFNSNEKTVDALMKLQLPSGVEVEIKV